MVKLMIITVFCILILSTVASACIELTDGMKISASEITICEKKYSLPNGIKIGKSDVKIDLNNAIISGSLEGKGIDINGFDNIIIKNGIVRDYTYNIYAQDSRMVTLNDLTLKNAFYGVYYNNAQVVMQNIDFSNNDQDVFESTQAVEESYIKEKPIKKEEEIILKEEKVNLENSFENQVDINLVQDLGLKRKYDKAKEVVKISKEKEITSAGTVFTTKVKVNRSVKDLRIYEVIPKELVEYASLIESPHEFEIIREDPVIVFRLGDVVEGEEKAIIYEISKPELSAVNPFSVASIESFLNPTGNKVISTLLAIAIILILANSFLKKEIQIRTGEE